MQAIVYYITLPFIYLLSLLPFWLLYGVSDVVFIILYYAAGYRKKIITENLKKSFPEKSEKEIAAIRKRYYRYLCDLILETFKSLSISRQNMLRHCRMSSEARKLFERYYTEKKSILVVMGHYGNWEWSGNTFSILCQQQLYVIYHRLRNPYFDRLIYNMRTRFGTKLIEMKNTFRGMLSNKNEINATAFIADQTPQPDNAYWITFLNQETPVFQGTEVIARKFNYPVIYATVKRLRRGYYEIFAETLLENPSSSAEGQITEMHTRKLEQDIGEQPEIWLWSHRRWKHKR